MIFLPLRHRALRGPFEKMSDVMLTLVSGPQPRHSLAADLSLGKRPGLLDREQSERAVDMVGPQIAQLYTTRNRDRQGPCCSKLRVGVSSAPPLLRTPYRYRIEQSKRYCLPTIERPRTRNRFVGGSLGGVGG
jgi:hypothetical protein